MFNSDKYLSVKWLKGGRVYPELDCFGIINEIRGDLLLPLWPDFSGVTKDEGGLDREARKFMKFLTRCEPCVVGIVVLLDGQLQVAECNPGTNVTFLPLPRFVRRFNRVEFWQ